MKTIKFLTTVFLCSLIFTSCSKDEGGGDSNEDDAQQEAIVGLWGIYKTEEYYEGELDYTDDWGCPQVQLDFQSNGTLFDRFYHDCDEDPVEVDEYEYSVQGDEIYLDGDPTYEIVTVSSSELALKVDFGGNDYAISYYEKM